MSVMIFAIGLGTITGIGQIENTKDRMVYFTTGTPTAVPFEITVMDGSQMIYHTKSKSLGCQVFKYGEKVILILPQEPG